jgi:transcriptional regulator with XRE-family HTH domain
MNAETTPSIGALLKEYRLAAGLTQEVLAERAGISVRGVQAIEGSINKPYPETARRLANALGLVEDERARLIALATPSPRRRAPAAPSSVIAFTAPWAVAPAAVETRPPQLAPVRQRPAVPGDMLDGVVPAVTPRNPYKGLRAFRAEDAGDFFGREALVAELVASVQACARPDAARFLAVVGPSGSGKSSVALAGLLPRLRHGAVPGSTGWVYLAPLLPGTHPIEALSVAVAAARQRSSLTAIRADLDASERGLHLLAGRLASQPETRVLLVIDQAEELFTSTADEEERRKFIDLLVTAACEPRGSLVVVLTLRADFYDRPMRYSQLGRLVAAQSVAVLPLVLQRHLGGD